MLTMHTLLPLTESTNLGGRGVVNVQDSYVKLIPVQKALIAKYALASGNKAAILLRYTKEFQTEINYKMSSVSMRKAKYVSELKYYIKSNSAMAVEMLLFLKTTHYTQLQPKTSRHTWYQTPTECQHRIVR